MTSSGDTTSQSAEDGNSTEAATVEMALVKIAHKLPGPLRHRFQSTLDHFDRAYRIFDVDREMASFRAITGEEEAATALIRAIQLRGYPDSGKLIAHRHQHKAAVIACVTALHSRLAPILADFQIVFHFEKVRVDVKVPLSAFGVQGGDDVAIQPVEPLDLLHTRPGVPQDSAFDDVLGALAGRSGFATVKKMVDTQANARNRLLYASDTGLPASKATLQSLQIRKRRALAMLVLTIMVYQSHKHLATVRQAVPAVISVISRIPKASE